MSTETDFDKQVEDATEKCIELLSEVLEAGVIIGTYIDEHGETQKYSRPWGNEFAVTRLVQVQKQEDDMANAIVLGSYCDED